MIETMSDIISTPLFCITLTVAVYLSSLRIYKKTRLAIMHPILVSVAVIAVILRLSGLEYETYYESNGIINFLLGFSVVALGYLLYEKMGALRHQLKAILISVCCASLAGVASVTVIAYFFGNGADIIFSLQPKSVTTPVALELSKFSGGIPSLTVMAVIVTGLLGSIIGPRMLKLLKVTDPVANGIALGSASHAVGTARALETGALEGAAGGVAIGLMGIFTALFVPLFGLILG